MRFLASWLASSLLLSAALVSAQGQAVPFGPHDVRSMFYVAKSENQNQIHYGARLDVACRPMGKRPVFAYWRRLRGTQRVDDPLVGLGTRFYGASEAQIVKAGVTGGSVDMFVNALPQVRIRVVIEKAQTGCRASAFTHINREPARLSHAYLQLARVRILGLKYVDVVGFRVRDGARVIERHD